jgi:hypothetical protein
MRFGCVLLFGYNSQEAFSRKNSNKSVYMHTNFCFFGSIYLSKGSFLSHLADGDHTLNVVGKNSLESWQNKSMATIVQWTIDTHILPPTHLKLHTDYDSGLFNTDLITNQIYIRIEGQCEANAIFILVFWEKETDQSSSNENRNLPQLYVERIINGFSLAFY